MAAFVFASGVQNTARPVQGAGVYQRDPNLNAPGVFPLNKTTVPLRIGVETSNLVENFDTNYQVRMLQEKGNYKFTFEIYPAGQLMQQVELMVMAGGADLPDVLWSTFNPSRLVKFGQAGMILPLNTYYQNTAHFIPEMQKQFSIDIVKYITGYDGNVYGFPGMVVAMNNEYSGNWVLIYEPWLKTLGLEMAGTIQEFENVLKAFKERDPNGNGRADEIPLIGERNTSVENMLRFLMNPFIYAQPDLWMQNNGIIDVSFNKPAFRDGLRYAKSLMDQGLISPLSFTQDTAQMTAMITPDPTIIGAYARISPSNLGGTDRKRLEYTIQKPLEGPGGRHAFYNPELPWIKMIITKNCKYPESAFVLGDYMCSEEQSVMNRFGIKGIDWRDPAPGEESAYKSVGGVPLMAPITMFGVLQNNYLGQVGPFLVHEKWSNGTVPSGFDVHVTLGRSIKPYVDLADRNPVRGMIYNEQEQAVMDEFHATIMSYVKESYARFVTGDLSIDRDWDNYVAQFNRMGLRDVITATQSAWNRMNR